MRRPLLTAVTTAVAAATVLGACSSGDAQEASSGGSSTTEDFPVTIEHAFGSTEITQEPERVVTWGWGSADAAVALGVTPVAMPYQSYGGDDEGVLPWLRERIEQEGEETPTVLPDVDEAPVEAILAAEPDLILAPYSGITAAEYELLSQVAPTVAYPEEAWATPWRETVQIVGEALGRSDEAEDLLADIDSTLEEEAEQYPELQGTSVAVVWSTADTFYVYKPADARVEFTLDLGLTSAESVETLSEGQETFFYTLSPERLSDLTSDVLVSYADTQEASDAFLASPQAQLMEQVQTGAVAEVVGTELIAAVSPPTALSLTYGLEEYVASLAEAARAAAAA